MIVSAPVRLSRQALESYLWGAANLLRGLVDAGDYKQYVFPLLFFKRLSDVWDEEYRAALDETGDEGYARATAGSPSPPARTGPTSAWRPATWAGCCGTRYILASLDPRTGRCAVLFPHGVLFRNEKAAMRRALVERDLVDCVLGLGPSRPTRATARRPATCGARGPSSTSAAGSSGGGWTRWRRCSTG